MVTGSSQENTPSLNASVKDAASSRKSYRTIRLECRHSKGNTPMLSDSKLRELIEMAGEAIGPQSDRCMGASYSLKEYSFVSACSPTTIQALCQELLEARSIIKEFARQDTPEELEEPDDADYACAYEMFVLTARDYLAEFGGEKP